MHVKSAEFIVSCPNIRSCPPPDKPEYAFIGRSNVGKSSLINMLTGRRKLAKTSATPGKTQLLNYFIINNEWYLVDLPGLGYAKISKTLRNKFEQDIAQYLLKRENLVTIFLLIDSRLEPQKIDLDFITWLKQAGLPFILLFTKTDKLSSNQLTNNIQSYMRFLAKHWKDIPAYFLSSAKTMVGKDDILDYIARKSEALEK